MSHVLLVLGCHRSGTSLIARSLECLGAELGPEAKWSGPDNPDFAEDQDVLAINKSLMAHIGSDWGSPRPLDWSPLGAMLASESNRQVRALIAERLTRYPLWALKEPRLCRLLPFWKPIFYALGCKVSIVHAIRHPMAVARSLERRNQIPIATGLELWLEYTRRAFEDVDPAWGSVTVEYDLMMSVPLAQVARIGNVLGLTILGDATVKFAQETVDGALWHEVIENDAGLPDDVAALWRWVRREARR